MSVIADFVVRFSTSALDAASPYLKPEALDYLTITMTNIYDASSPYLKGETSSDYLTITMTNLVDALAQFGDGDAFLFGAPAAETLTDIAAEVIGGYIGETEKNLDAARAAWDVFDDFAWFDEGQAQEALADLF
ncbi:hypothetical protein ACQ5SO_12225 [Rhodovulum sp. DZ06]|uniref:hypothetical protein n=1 Tax=Rhodovulum sp. DZ06 TaxID=3425126 RepID=UPI003D326CFC